MFRRRPAPARRRRGAPLIWRCRISSPEKVFVSRCCRKARTPTISRAPADARAIEEVIAAARGLADVIWSREIEGGSYATPERRAALEARIGELTNGIRDEVVRRYYRQDLAERLQRTFAPEGGRGGYDRGNFRGGGQTGFGGSESGRRFAPARRAGSSRSIRRSRARPSRRADPRPRAPIRPPAPSWRPARSCAASAARCPAARR